MKHTRLRAERRRRGWSQARLARLVGVDHSTVSYWESGDTLPRRKTAAKLADIFGISAEELLSQNDEAAKPKSLAAV